MRPFRLIFVLSVALLGLSGARTVRAEECGVKELPVAKTDATASAWANLRNNEGSIRYESAELLGKALAEFTELKPPGGLCANGCGKPEASLVFSSVPRKFRSDYSDKEKCARLEAATRSAPFAYHGRTFASQDEFNAWFSDFSQGKGKDGSDLYQRCDGDCSPQYFTSIVPAGGNLLVDSDVICGEARDKDDNLYVLTFAYRWECKKE